MCGAFILLLPLILTLFCLTGCIQENASSGEISSSEIGSPSPVRVEASFDPEVSGSLFRARGSLALSGNGSLSYLLLNATLQKSGRPLCSTKYVMMDVSPGTDYSFEISKNMRLWPGDYSCILDILSPEGQMASYTRQCRNIEPFFDKRDSSLGQLSAQGRSSAAFSAGSSVASSAASSVISSEASAAAEEQLKVSTKPAKQKVESLEKENKSIEKSGVLPSEPSVSKEGSFDHVDDSPDNPGLKDNEMDESSEEAAAGKSEPGTETLKEGMLVGSTTSNKYHRPDCRYAVKIRPENRIYFENEEEAKRQGYIPCKACNP